MTVKPRIAPRPMMWTTRRRTDEHALEQTVRRRPLRCRADYAVGACEGQLPTPAADSSTKTQPDLTEAQEKKIRTKILETIDQADAARSADAIRP